MNSNLKFNNEMKYLSICVYKGKEKYKPKDWIKFDEHKSNNGFYGEAFYKNGIILIALRGTNISELGDIASDRSMTTKHVPSQYVDAQKFYKQIASKFSNEKIVFTGHSLGGSLAQLMGAEMGSETVTFNAYGIGDLIQKDNVKGTNNRNYGNIDDTVFNANLKNQFGKTYIIGSKEKSPYLTSSDTTGYKSGQYPMKKHSIENMGNLEDAVEYKKPEELGSNLLKANVSYDINARDIDKKRVITREEIAKMSKDEFERNENFINQQLKLGNIMSKAQADEKVKTGDLIWVNSYNRDDGTKVCGYYRRK